MVLPGYYGSRGLAEAVDHPGSVLESSYPYSRVHHINTWLDADPSPLLPYAQADVLKAKKKLFGIDRRTGQLRAPTRPFAGGDLVAALDFGFWTGMFNTHYLYQSSRDQRLWPHGLAQVFPHAPSPPVLHTISGRLNHLRHLRNRTFHHEPIWRRPNLAGDRDEILELADWMSPEIGRTLRATERFTNALSDDFRRELRVRIYRESRK